MVFSVCESFIFQPSLMIYFSLCSLNRILFIVYGNIFCIALTVLRIQGGQNGAKTLNLEFFI